VRHHSVIGLLLIAGAATIVGCGGGTSQPAVPRTVTPGGGSAAPATLAKATFTLTLPAASGTAAKTRTPKYISPNAQSIGIAIATGSGTATPTLANLTPSSPNCTTPAGGSLTCAIVVAAPLGGDTFVVTLYAGPNGSGSVLSTASIAGTVSNNAANTIPITLDGVVAAIAVSVTNGNDLVPGGYPTALPVVVTAQDASGATIVGPAAYANPITLSNADTSGVTALSTTSVTSPQTTVTLTYAPTDANGGVLNVAGLPVGATQIGAGATGVSTAAVTPGTFQYVADRFWGFGHTRTLSGAGTVVTTSYTAAGSPMPSPSTWAYSMTDEATVHASASFDGVSTIDTNHVVSYTQTAPTALASPEVYTYDDYRAYTLDATGSTLYRYGEAVVDANPWGFASPPTGDLAGTTTLLYTYPNPGAWIDDVLPHATRSWSNTGNPLTEAYSGAETATFAYHADGSASFVETAPGTIALNQTAAGAATNVDGNVTTTIGLPIPAPSGSGDVIPVVQQTTAPTPGPTSSSDAADWYPGGGAPVQPLFAWNDTESWVAIPPACNVPSTVATQAWAIAYDETQVRPMNFELRTRTQTDYFVPAGVGWVCSTYTETDNDYRFKTGIISSSTTIAWTYGVTSTTDLGLKRRAAARP